MTKEELDREVEKMSWDEQNWLFNRLMDRLWPELAGKRVALKLFRRFWKDDEAIPKKTMSGSEKGGGNGTETGRRGI